MKGVRNNLLTKDLIINYDEKKKPKDQNVASWAPIIVAYEADLYCLQGERQMPKLSDSHIYPKQIKKMSVHHCTEVFYTRWRIT